MQEKNDSGLDYEATREKITDWITQRCEASIDEILHKAMQDQKVFLIMTSFGLVLEDEIVSGIARCCEVRLNKIKGENDGK